MPKKYEYFVSWAFQKEKVGSGYDNGVYVLNKAISFEIIKSIEEDIITSQSLKFVTVLNFILLGIADISNEEAAKVWGKAVDQNQIG